MSSTSGETVVPDVSRPGYPAWQASVTAGFGFGGIEPVVDKLSWLWRLCRRLWHWKRRAELEVWIDRIDQWTPEQRAVVERSARCVESALYREARLTVRATAKTIGFNHPEAWVPYSRLLKSDPNQAQNMYRHVKAVQDVKLALRAQGSTVTNPEAHLAVELAYVGFAWSGR